MAGFEALKNFKPSRENPGPSNEKKNQSGDRGMEDRARAERIAALAGSDPSKSKNLANSLTKIIAMSRKGDVFENIKQLFPNLGDLPDKAKPEIRSIMNDGFTSEAARWIKMTDARAMEKSAISKEEKMVKAEEFARKAGKTVQAIVGERNLQRFFEK